MNASSLLSVLSALAAAVWSVWTWQEDQNKDRALQKQERDLRRNQEAALYVNPFMLAIDELQSGLYSILEEDELAWYRSEFPGTYEFGSPAAIQLLYRLCQYFGWAYRLVRFGPYTRDARVIALIRDLGDVFETRSRYTGVAFRFSYDERVSLGEAVVRRVGDAPGDRPVFESIPWYQFEVEINDLKSKQAPLFQSRAVRATLAAVDESEHIDALEGRERLAMLQNLLVDLLLYLEGREGFQIASGRRTKACLPNAPALADPPGTVKLLHQCRGRIRLGVPRLLSDPAYGLALKAWLEKLDHVSSVRVNAAAASVAIGYSLDVPGREFFQLVTAALDEL